MFQSTFFRDELITVIHPAKRKVTKKILDGANATFVWGELMDPHFIRNLLGEAKPFASAHVRGMVRRPTRKFFNVTRNESGVVPGVVLLGLTSSDIKKLNEFERVGEVMERHQTQVVMGQRIRTAYIYLKKK